MGADECLGVEVVMVPNGAETWLLLREPRAKLNFQNPQPGLTGAFEYVATILRHEFVYLHRLPDSFKFFHATYTMVPTTNLNWSVEEVMLLLRDEQYVYARWLELDELTREILIAALNSLGPPTRKHLQT